jgi:2-dehydro-3-deoxygluconokinase
MSELVTIGETMALLTTPLVGRLRDMTSLQLSVAGAESNVAIGVSRLGHAASWVGRLGDDELGQMILGLLRKEGVDVSRSIVDPEAQTAIMFKERRTADVVRVTYYRHGYAGSRLCPEDLDEGHIGSARVLHVTGITLGLSGSARAAVYRAVEVARASGVLVSFDFNYRSALWCEEDAVPEMARMASLADLVFAGEDELAMLSLGGDLVAGARQLADDGAREIVVKRGAEGALSVTKDGVYEEPALPVRAVDPVGAGDAFVAGYLTGFLDGAGPVERLRQACATGAFVVAMVGDWEGSPGRDDLSLLRYRAGTTLR